MSLLPFLPLNIIETIFDNNKNINEYVDWLTMCVCVSLTTTRDMKKLCLEDVVVSHVNFKNMHTLFSLIKENNETFNIKKITLKLQHETYENAKNMTHIMLQTCNPISLLHLNLSYNQRLH